MLKRTYLVVGVVFWGVVSFIVTVALGPVLALFWALVTGGAAMLFARSLDEIDGKRSGAAAPIVSAAGAATIAALLTLVGEPVRPVWVPWLGVALSAGSAWWVTTLAAARAREFCFICKKAVVMFPCPRCHMHICQQPTCWVARHARCRYCLEREIVLFPIAERWWASRLGRRVSKGECANCYEESHEADLRACGQCHWTMCKRCWDYRNGQCVHCDWTIPDMPAEIYRFIGQQAAAAAGHARRETARR